ncbi:hypothetical protein AB5N19_10352 [Seiridium cardinale]
MPQPNTFPNEIWLLVAVESHGRGLTGIAGASTHMRNMLISHLAERLRFQGTQGEVVTALRNFQDTQLLRYDRTSRLPPILPFVRRVAIVVKEAVPAIPIVPDGQLPLPTGGIDLPIEIVRLLVSSQIPTFDSLFLDIWDMHLTQSLMKTKLRLREEETGSFQFDSVASNLNWTTERTSDQWLSLTQPAEAKVFRNGSIKAGELGGRILHLITV